MSDSEQQNIKDDAAQDDDTQRESQGRDPNTEGPDHPKMTGEGEPGSHSAYFGLTPDGTKDENTQSATTAPKPAESKDKGGDDGDDGGDNSSGGGVSDQLNDPKVNEGAHGKDAGKETTEDGDKIGSGTGMTNPSQGTGDVGSDS